jgi:hypothetical protein
MNGKRNTMILDDTYDREIHGYYTNHITDCFDDETDGIMYAGGGTCEVFFEHGEWFVKNILTDATALVLGGPGCEIPSFEIIYPGNPELMEFDEEEY